MQLDEGALSTLLDGPAPAPTTTLAVVVRRGRRQVHLRALSVATVVVLVIGMVSGFVVVAASPPVSPPVAAGKELDWPQVDVRPPWMRTVRASAPAVPDPLLGPDPVSACPTGVQPQLAFTSIETTDLLKVQTALVRALPETKVGTWQGVSSISLTGTGGVTNIVELDLTDSDGVASFSISRGSFTGSATDYATALAFVDGNCAAPKRRTTSEGTVIQVYPPVPEANQVVRMKARVFWPDGKVLILEARNVRVSAYSARVGMPSVFDGGPVRYSLPMTERQLGEVAELYAAA
ncbi:hypothetical protein [Actinokineospora diospyrosa]|uniref:Uncharacterized protein n=1 Tax=Actinokineospora diospyrosa TaxID=103728 RepID=A0ABT1ICW5_9PSEU|nr:hypothetical protein [Actinokineospora diospyrosa]MCP2270478.1 hypothetical protein [Actinokineospora diospyrosa]